MPGIGFGTSSLAIAARSSPPPSSSAIATSTPPGNTAPSAASAKACARRAFRATRFSSPPRCRTNICAPTISRARSTRAWRSLGVDYRRSAAGALAECRHSARGADRLRSPRRSGWASRVISAWRTSTSRCSTEAIALCSEPLVDLAGRVSPLSRPAEAATACRERGWSSPPIVRSAAAASSATRCLRRSRTQGDGRWRRSRCAGSFSRATSFRSRAHRSARRMRENLGVFDFCLTDDEMARISALKRPDGRIADPAGRAPAWD